MKNNRIRLTENQLHNVIKKSVKKVLKEDVMVPDEDIEEYEEIVERLDSAYNEFHKAIIDLQTFHYNHDSASATYDMYNSYAGKYGDEAKRMLMHAYSHAAKLFIEDYDDEFRGELIKYHNGR